RRRRGACPPRARAAPSRGTGTPWSRTRHRRETQWWLRGSGPGGAPRRRRTTAYRTAGRAARGRTRRWTAVRPIRRWRSRAATRAVARRPARRSHRVGRRHADQSESDDEAYARGLDEPKAGLRQLGRYAFAHHVAVVVEAVHRRRVLAQPR